MHEAWHVSVLVFTLLAAAGLAVVLLGPLVFGTAPPGLRRARPFVGVVTGVAVVLLVVEWLAVH